MASVASTVSTNIVPVQGQFDANGNCLGLIGPGGVAFYPPLAGDNATVSTINATTQYQIAGKMISSATTPTIAAGFGGNATITATSTASFKVVVGSSATSNSGTLTFPAAPNGWVVIGNDITQASNVYLQQSASNATSATLLAFSNTTGGAANLTAGDVILFTATAY